MQDVQALYDEAKGDLQAITDPLFEFGKDQVLKRGAFLPFGATLDGKGEIQLHGVAGENEITTGTEILPLLHEGLRQSRKEDTQAVAVCEWVKITPEKGRLTNAIKVLVEHTNGLAVAFYLPMRKKFLGGWQVGEIIVTPASPEVGA